MRSILIAAQSFRKAIEHRPLNLASFASFPTGSCGDASELLGQYFIDSGFGQWIYRTGYTSSLRSHGWIEQDGVLADITADQFEKWDAPKPVIVTHDRVWHDRYFPNQNGSRLAGLGFWDGPTHDQMVLVYEDLRALADGFSADPLN